MMNIACEICNLINLKVGMLKLLTQDVSVGFQCSDLTILICGQLFYENYWKVVFLNFMLLKFNFGVKRRVSR